jgi:hypothetical protein
MARIEAGLETPQTLNGPVRAWQPDEGAAAPDGGPRGSGVLDMAPADSGWELQIDTEPSQFRGLTRVTVKALKRASEGSDQTEASYTLRQLVRLGGKGEDTAGSADSLADEAKRGLETITPAQKGGDAGAARAAPRSNAAARQGSKR